MKLSACLIVKNEAGNLAAALESVRPFVDEICITDTGSTDDSALIAKKYADKWQQFTDCNFPDGQIADFSAARNANLRQATGDAMLWLDADDVLHGGAELRKLVSEAPRGQSGAFSMLARYDYDHDAARRVVTQQWRERLIGPAPAFEWRFPIHEALLARAGHDPGGSITDKFWVEHRPAKQKQREPGRNLRILREWFAKHGEAEQRLMHYFGAELLLQRNIGESLYWLRRHVAVAPWSDERCLSQMLMTRIYLAIGDNEQAAHFALQATAIKSWREPQWLLGQAYCALAEQGINAEYNYRRGLHALKRGFELTEQEVPSTLLMIDPTMRFEAHAWYGAALAKLGMIDAAIAETEKCLSGIPEHETARKNLDTWRADRARNQMRAGMIELHQLGALTRESGIAIEAALRGEVKLERLLPAAASGAHPPEPLQTALRHLDSDKLRIAFWLGHQLEPWTPETLMRDGMGGSETMAWEMSRRLAKLGHEVTVYGHCDPQVTEIYDAVLWLDASHFQERNDDGSGMLDVLIVSRQASAVMQPHHARARILWVHDVHCGPDLVPQVAAKYDAIWCLSNWHREFFLGCYPWLAPQKVEVTRNGIDLERFKRTDIKREPHRAIYSSSPDRGLITAIKAWPKVREKVPNAELHVFYGFENWERSLVINPGAQPAEWLSREAITELKLLCQTTQGVVRHGRVNGAQLAEEMLRSSVWCYPTWFSETSCITAMEAQAAALICVCPPLAALQETVFSPQWTESFVDDMVKAFDSKLLFRDCESFDLDSLATEWESRLQTAVKRVVPAFAEVQP